MWDVGVDCWRGDGVLAEMDELPPLAELPAILATLVGPAYEPSREAGTSAAAALQMLPPGEDSGSAHEDAVHTAWERLRAFSASDLAHSEEWDAVPASMSRVLQTALAATERACGLEAEAGGRVDWWAVEEAVLRLHAALLEHVAPPQAAQLFESLAAHARARTPSATGAPDHRCAVALAHTCELLALARETLAREALLLPDVMRDGVALDACSLALPPGDVGAAGPGGCRTPAHILASLDVSCRWLRLFLARACWQGAVWRAARASGLVGWCIETMRASAPRTRPPLDTSAQDGRTALSLVTPSELDFALHLHAACALAALLRAATGAARAAGDAGSLGWTEEALHLLVEGTVDVCCLDEDADMSVLAASFRADAIQVVAQELAACAELPLPRSPPAAPPGSSMGPVVHAAIAASVAAARGTSAWRHLQRMRADTPVVLSVDELADRFPRLRLVERSAWERSPALGAARAAHIFLPTVRQLVARVEGRRQLLLADQRRLRVLASAAVALVASTCASSTSKPSPEQAVGMLCLEVVECLLVTPSGGPCDDTERGRCELACYLTSLIHGVLMTDASSQGDPVDAHRSESRPAARSVGGAASLYMAAAVCSLVACGSPRTRVLLQPVCEAAAAWRLRLQVAAAGPVARPPTARGGDEHTDNFLANRLGGASDTDDSPDDAAVGEEPALCRASVASVAGPSTAAPRRGPVLQLVTPSWMMRTASLASTPTGARALAHEGLPIALARLLRRAARSDAACAPLHSPPFPGAAYTADLSPLLASMTALLCIFAWPHAISAAFDVRPPGGQAEEDDAGSFCAAHSGLNQAGSSRRVPQGHAGHPGAVLRSALNIAASGFLRQPRQSQGSGEPVAVSLLFLCGLCADVHASPILERGLRLRAALDAALCDAEGHAVWYDTAACALAIGRNGAPAVGYDGAGASAGVEASTRAVALSPPAQIARGSPPPVPHCLEEVCRARLMVQLDQWGTSSEWAVHPAAAAPSNLFPFGDAPSATPSSTWLLGVSTSDVHAPTKVSEEQGVCGSLHGSGRRPFESALDVDGLSVLEHQPCPNAAGATRPMMDASFMDSPWLKAAASEVIRALEASTITPHPIAPSEWLSHNGDDADEPVRWPRSAAGPNVPARPSLPILQAPIAGAQPSTSDDPPSALILAAALKLVRYRARVSASSASSSSLHNISHQPSTECPTSRSNEAAGFTQGSASCDGASINLALFLRDVRIALGRAHESSESLDCFAALCYLFNDGDGPARALLQGVAEHPLAPLLWHGCVPSQGGKAANAASGLFEELLCLVDELVEAELPLVASSLRRAGIYSALLTSRWLRQNWLNVLPWPQLTRAFVLPIIAGAQYQVRRAFL